MVKMCIFISINQLERKTLYTNIHLYDTTLTLRPRLRQYFAPYMTFNTLGKTC